MPDRSNRTPYAELQVTTNFTFLTGASHPEEMVRRAAELGHRAIAVTDRGSLAGLVRAHVAAREAGIPFVVGCRLEIPRTEASPPLSLLVYPTDRAAYGRLCRLLTLGKRRAKKGECRLEIADLLAHQAGLLAVLVPPDDPGPPDAGFAAALPLLADAFDDDRLSLAVSSLGGPDDRRRLERLETISAESGVPLVATNDTHYHAAERRPLQDVLACIRRGVRVDDAGLALFPNAERALKEPAAMARLFARHPRALARGVEIAERAGAFSLDELRYEYPDEVSPPGVPPMRHLADLAWAGAADRYPGGLPSKVRRQIEHELALVEELGYAPYFLTVHDLVVFARARGILCQGRGAAANSAICYCLGVTAVDPDRIEVLFERFVSRERREPPDIDIDFEHERREEVIQHVYAKYGRDRAALAAEVITYRERSALREVGKALGLSLDAVERLADAHEDGIDGADRPGRVRRLGLDPEAPTVRAVLALAREILGFPRHLSQHVGGFVISRGPLCELVPIENAAMPARTVIEWDKDDIDALGILKVDVLGLGMLTCLRKTFDLIAASAKASAPRALHEIPPEDPAVYDMLGRADTIGVFQIESRAQMAMLPRLRPRCFYDLVIEVAIVRPGPIQGGMVHPYLRRRAGEEPVSFPDEAVEKVLGRTLGIPLFQEQAMALAVVAAGFTPGEAEQLRRAMAAWKRRGREIELFARRLVAGMLARGYPREFAGRCVDQIEGFSEYGFPESHAASFALLVYASAWLKRHHPAAFAAALLNSQPMGFYAPAQIVRDARAHGVAVAPVDVNASRWDCSLEPSGGEDAPPGTLAPAPLPAGTPPPPRLRLGMRLVKGLPRDDADAVARAVERRGAFDSVEALHDASGARASALRALARADAFRSMRLDRPAALWQVRALRDGERSMFPAKGAAQPPPLPAVSPAKSVVDDYASLHLSLKGHPFSFLRRALERRGVSEAARLASADLFPRGRRASVAGLVLVRQRPATAGGIVFVTIEDETGIANLVVHPAVYERHGAVVRTAFALLARGRIDRTGEVVHLVAGTLESLDARVGNLASTSRDFH